MKFFALIKKDKLHIEAKDSSQYFNPKEDNPNLFVKHQTFGGLS